MTSVAPPPAVQTQTADVLLRLDFSGNPLEPQIVSYRVRVTDEDGFVELIPESVQARQSDTQEFSLSGIPVGFVRLLVEGLDEEGSVLASWSEDLQLSDSQTVTVQQLLARGNTREIGLVSVGSNGAASDGDSSQPRLSDTGRFVAFASKSASLTGRTFVEILVRDRQDATLSLVSGADESGLRLRGNKSDPDISGTGRFVSFVVAARGAEGAIYRRDRGFRGSTPVTARASGALQGQSISVGANPRISADGSKVVFQTTIAGLSQVVLFDFNTQSFELVSRNGSGVFANGNSRRPCVSADGRFVAFSSDATDLIGGGTKGVYVRDRLAGLTTRLAVNQGLVNTEISADGRFIVASAQEARPAVVDQALATIDPIPVGAGLVGKVDISNDGRFLSFLSNRTDLVPNDLNGRTDAFIQNLETDEIFRVNVSNDGTAVLGGVEQLADSLPALSGDGRRVAFASSDSLLVPNNANTNQDIYSANVPTTGRLYVGAKVDDVHLVLQCLDPRTGQTLAQVSNLNFINSPFFMRLALDTTNDRLYALHIGSSATQVSVFNNISTLDGQVNPTRLLSLSGPVGFDPRDMAIDTTRNKLYLAQKNQILIYDNLATINGEISTIPHRTLSPSPTLNGIDTILLDVRRDELYVGLLTVSAQHEVAVFGAASTAQGSPLPVRKLAGANPFVGLAFGVQAIPTLFFDQSPAGAVGANRSALVLVDRQNSWATFPESGILGDVPATPLVVRPSSNACTAYDPLSNLVYTVFSFVPPTSRLERFPAGSTQVAPASSAITPIPLQNFGSMVLDRTH